MARKVCTVTITDEGRDKGKLFQITELSAMDAEEWAIRAFLALANTGVQIPEDVAALGLAGLAAVGFEALGKLPYSALEPLLKTMFQCVKIIPDPNVPNVVRDLIGDDIEEVKTRLQLRQEVFKLHTGFFPNVGALTSAPAGE